MLFVLVFSLIHRFGILDRTDVFHVASAVFMGINCSILAYSSVERMYNSGDSSSVS